MSGAALKYTCTQAPTFMLAGFMSWSVKAINKPVFPAVCLPVQAPKKRPPHGQTGRAKEPCVREGEVQRWPLSTTTLIPPYPSTTP